MPTATFRCLLRLLCLALPQLAAAQNPDLPPAAATPVAVPVGTLILAMDNAWQTTTGSFNLKAYGLAVAMLNNKVPLRWVIRSGKGKDEIDFTAQATRIIPRAAALPVAARAFRSGPLLVLPRDTAGVRALTTAFNVAQNTAVCVYEIQEPLTVDVRYVLNQRPVAAILNDGGNAAIHQGYMRLAGISGNNNATGLRPQDNYATQPAINLDGQTDCFTFAAEPHSANTAGGVVEAIRRFVERGGNFLAECEAVVTYENYVNGQVGGRFQTSGGVTDADVRDNTARRYPAPNQPFSQFEGEFRASVLGGSVTNWRRTSGSSFVNGAHPQDLLASTTDEVIEASVSDHFAGRGGLVFYLGGHQYSGTTESDLNGQRMFLNAFLTPATTFQSCNVFADVSGNPLATALRYTICLYDSAAIRLPAGTEPETYIWSPTMGLSSTTSNTVQASPTVSTTYTVQATGASGAVRYLGVRVTVVSSPVVSIRYAGCVPLVEQEVQFTADVAGTDYRWDFGDGTPATFEPNHRYTRPGSYVVRLRGTSATGCPVQASAPLVVTEMKVPNIFTPNADGRNDTFKLPGLLSGEASLQVFNRWGTRVYTTDHYANEWDGAQLPAGNYFYLIKVAGCATTFKGWVELVR